MISYLWVLSLKTGVAVIIPGIDTHAIISCVKLYPQYTNIFRLKRKAKTATSGRKETQITSGVLGCVVLVCTFDSCSPGDMRADIKLPGHIVTTNIDKAMIEIGGKVRYDDSIVCYLTGSN